MISEWRETTVGAFCPFKYGKGLPKRDRKEGMVPLYSSAGLIGSHATALVNSAGVIIGRKGTVGSVNFSDKSFWAIDTVFYVEDDPTTRNIRYTYYLLKTLGLDLMNTDSAVPGLNRDNAHALEVSVPHLNEQKAIADFLGHIDDRINLYHQANLTLEAITQALFKSWFVDFDPVKAKKNNMRPEGMDEATADLFSDSFKQSELGEIPSGWTVSNVSSQLTVILGGTPSRAKSEFWSGGTVSWINSGKVNDFRITTPSELITEEAVTKSATKLLPSRTTVIAITGATLGQISILEIPACANQSVIGLPSNEIFSTEYIYFWIKSNIQKLLSSQTGGAQQHINKGNVEQLPLLIPDLRILHCFKSIVEPLQLSLANNCFKVNTLSSLRDTLLPRFISGQLRLPEAENLIEAFA